MDISALRDRTDTTMTVSELNSYIKMLFDSDRHLNSVCVKGEISNFVNHRTGHLYFSLKDEDGDIRAVMFRTSAMKLKFMPENGMKVTVFGSVTVYPKNGSYQIYVNSMQPDGVGALYVAYEQLKAKLSAEGLFDEENKKPIPRFPERIGVVTSPTGAAIRDIINVLGRRYPSACVYIYPALVQGDGAAGTLIDGIDYFDRSGLVDTVIIGRGGGSIEDLWAFNDETLARRIYECRIPVISAVGHETDYTICDFVSDLRAPTPSAAAELCVPDIRELMIYLDILADKSERALFRSIEKKRERLDSIMSKRVLTNPCDGICLLKDKILFLLKNADSAYSQYLSNRRYRLVSGASKLEALNPLSVLTRGYSVVQKDGKAVSSVKSLNKNDTLCLRMRDGEADVVVVDKRTL